MEAVTALDSLDIIFENHAGRSILAVGPDALIDLGAFCLHAATNAPLGYDEAIPVESVKHEVQPNGWHTLGFRVARDLEFFLTIPSDQAADLRDKLVSAFPTN